MFTFLYDSVFPLLGQFFGIVAGIAGTNCNDIIQFLFHGSVINYPNFFTGESWSISANYPLPSWLGENALRQLFNSYGLLNQPFFLSLLVLFASFFIFIVIVRFFVKILI